MNTRRPSRVTSRPRRHTWHTSRVLVYRGEAYLSLHECDAATADVDEARRIYDGLDDVAARRIEQLAQLQRGCGSNAADRPLICYVHSSSRAPTISRRRLISVRATGAADN